MSVFRLIRTGTKPVERLGRSANYHSHWRSVIRPATIFGQNGFDSRVQHHYGVRTRRNGKAGFPTLVFLPVQEASTVAKPELGTKRTCPETGRKFYDLNKDPIVSPYTGKTYPISFFEETAKIAVVEKEEEEEEVAEVEEESADVEIVSLEEADDETKVKGKSDDLPDIDDDVEIDDDDDDDTFLADDDDDDDDDVSDIIGVNDEDDD
tara:strand:- start:25415 stop:26038 length:624 start_codon:yes stop_codon:yes gene_type:complete